MQAAGLQPLGRAAGGRAGQPRVRDDLGQLVVAHLAEPRRPDKHRRVAVEVRVVKNGVPGSSTSASFSVSDATQNMITSA